ncbi:MAG TPA: Hpt domain-containing protein [Tepidisphaeraceae bacterium]|jgi:HPt (histidine-containing phosphotransfer) domain-containing protein|nr:Hpt domain-containing protein [Tepidisphaeraceae bacterium]
MNMQVQIDEPNATLYSSAIGDRDIAPCLPAFVAALPGYVVKIERLWTMKSLDPLRNVVHQIKGVGGVYGFAPLTDAARRAEQTLVDVAVADRIPPEVEALVQLIRRVDGYCGETEQMLAGRKQQ